MGKSYLDSKIRVLAPSPSGYKELIAFDAHADSGDMPGAAVMGPAGAAAGAGAAAVIATNAVAGGVKSYRSASTKRQKKWPTRSLPNWLSILLSRAGSIQVWLNKLTSRALILC